MPQLQDHQIRVASVASLICKNILIKVDIPEIITTALVHDMGNIIKFDLKLFPEYLEPEGLNYWQNIKDNFIKKYGNDEHLATYKIAEEIGISKRALEILKSMGYSKNIENSKHNDYSIKIAAYSDFRVAPWGVVSLMEREKDGLERMKKRKKMNNEVIKNQKVLLKHAKIIEKQVFDHCKLKPRDINDLNIKKHIYSLLDYKIYQL